MRDIKYEIYDSVNYELATSTDHGIEVKVAKEQTIEVSKPERLRPNSAKEQVGDQIVIAASQGEAPFMAFELVISREFTLTESIHDSLNGPYPTKSIESKNQITSKIRIRGTRKDHRV